MKPTKDNLPDAAETAPRDQEIISRQRERLMAGKLFHVGVSDVFSDAYAKIKRTGFVTLPLPKNERLFDSLREASDSNDFGVSATSIGTVSYIGNGVATLSGLPRVKLEELVEFPSGVQGMVLNLDRDHTDVIILGHDQAIRGGDIAYGTGKRLRVPVGPHFLGRIVDPLGKPLDGGKPIVSSENRLIERVAPGVVDRAPIDEPIYSGTKLIDSLIPIGKGQRELILGDRQTGKTTLAIDMILSQKGTNVKCVYVAIAQKKTSVLSAIEAFRAGGVFDQTTVILAGADDSPKLQLGLWIVLPLAILATPRFPRAGFVPPETSRVLTQSILAIIVPLIFWHLGWYVAFVFSIGVVFYILWLEAVIDGTMP